jgi:predicted DNA-binding protein with PD1-like motif
MLEQVTGQFGPVVVARLDPHADLLECLYEIARTNNMKAGVILSITGSLEHAVLQKFEKGSSNEDTIGVLEVEGPMEASGHGIIGIVDAPDRGDVPFGVAGYVHGEPYAHVHLSVTSAEHTLVGHVMKGCRVRSHQPISHFTIMVAPVEGVALKHTIDGTPESGHRGVYHLLEATS